MENKVSMLKKKVLCYYRNEISGDFFIQELIRKRKLYYATSFISAFRILRKNCTLIDRDIFSRFIATEIYAFVNVTILISHLYINTASHDKSDNKDAPSWQRVTYGIAL